MSWFLFALAAPVLLTFVNFVDKYIVEREVRDPRAMPIFAGIIGGLAASVLALLGAATVLSVRDILLLLAAGMLIIGGAIFYFRAASREQMSQIIFFNQLTPVFVLVLSWLVLNQAISSLQFAGFWLILGAVLAVSSQTGMGGLPVSSSFWLMMAVNATIAIRITLIGLLDAEPSFGTLFVYQGVGQSIGALLLYLGAPSFRHAFNQTSASMRKRALGIIGFNESLFVIAQVLNSLAITLGPAALVSVLGGTQVFYGIFLGWLLMMAAPGVFRESVTRRDLLRKVFFAAVLLVGLYLVLVP